MEVGHSFMTQAIPMREQPGVFFPRNIQEYFNSYEWYSPYCVAPPLFKFEITLQTIYNMVLSELCVKVILIIDTFIVTNKSNCLSLTL